MRGGSKTPSQSTVPPSKRRARLLQKAQAGDCLEIDDIARADHRPDLIDRERSFLDVLVLVRLRVFIVRTGLAQSCRPVEVHFLVAVPGGRKERAQTLEARSDEADLLLALARGRLLRF